MKRRHIITIVAASTVTALGVGALLILTPKAPTESKVPTSVVSTGTVTSSVSGKGVIAALATSNPSFSTPGTITSISVAIGQTVAVGQELAAIDPTEADRGLEKARGTLATAEEALTNTRKSYDLMKASLAAARARAKALPADSPDLAAANTTVREQEAALPSKDTEIVMAVKTRDDANRDVQAAQSVRDQTILKAPMGGVVTAVNGTVGSVVQGGGSVAGAAPSTAGSTGASGAGLVTISDISSLQVVAAIPEASIGRIALDQTASVSVTTVGTPPIGGVVGAIAPTPQTTAEGVVSYNVTIRLTEPPATVKLGQTGFVSITTATAADVLTLPSEAITLTGPTEGTVSIAPKKGSTVVRKVPVTIGLSGQGVTEIVKGVAKGDVVQMLVPTPSTLGAPAGAPTS